MCVQQNEEPVEERFLAKKLSTDGNLEKRRRLSIPNLTLKQITPLSSPCRSQSRMSLDSDIKRLIRLKNRNTNKQANKQANKQKEVSTVCQR
jgi:hypothetical protein